jgi:hypothetical protein
LGKRGRVQFLACKVESGHARCLSVGQRVVDKVGRPERGMEVARQRERPSAASGPTLGGSTVEQRRLEVHPERFVAMRRGGAGRGELGRKMESTCPYRTARSQSSVCLVTVLSRSFRAYTADQRWILGQHSSTRRGLVTTIISKVPTASHNGTEHSFSILLSYHVALVSNCFLCLNHVRLSVRSPCHLARSLRTGRGERLFDGDEAG